MRSRSRAGAALVVATGVLLVGTACGATPFTYSTPAPKRVDVVVIGDSIIDPSNGCGDCAGFAQLFAAQVGRSVGATPRVHLVTALGVPDALSAVTEDASTRKLVAAAEVVVVETGYNNALPDPETGIGCGGSLAQGFGAWMRSTRDACLRQGVATYGDLYSRIFTSIRALRRHRPTAFIATTSIDGNNGDPAVDQQGLLAAVPVADRGYALRWAIDAYVRWNTMLRQRATDARFQVVDLATAVNGEDGTKPWFPFTVDGAHPNEQGHALIAKQLGGADLTMLR